MAKAVIQMGYESYIMDAQDALKVYDIIGKAERYKQRYRRADEGGTMHWVWPQDAHDDIKNIQLMSDELYRIAKMAGKPEEQ